jgi:glycosyltransferase involved in cell wall biosynthesis
MISSTPPPTTVAVVIPTHNRADLLPTAVRSVLSQHLPDGASVQVVIVDDASDPPARTALRTDADQVLILRNNHPRGPATARNQGASATDADLVAFLDDDDRWLPGKIHACLAAFNAHPDAALVFHRVAFDWGSTDAPQTIRVVRDPVSRMLHHQPPHIDGVVVPRHVHQSVRFDESFRAAAELDYLLRVAMCGPVIELGAVLAVHGAQARRQSAIGVASRIDGRKQFREKHARLFDRKAKAYSDLRLAHQYRHLGQPMTAVGYSLRSLLWDPWRASPWKALVGSVLSDRQVEQIARSRRGHRSGG